MTENNIKTLLCAAVRLENNYIEEWVNYHKNLGIDKIVIFDNNELDGERVTDVPLIQQLAEEKYIDVIPQYGKRGIQTAQFTECYNLYYKNYDWLMFFDIDEYLVLTTHSNIKDYLTQEKFNDFDLIHVQWEIYDDNNLIRVENGDYSIMKRFTHPLDTNALLADEQSNNRYGYFYHKTIVRGLKYRKIKFVSGNTHTPCEQGSDRNLKACDANGKRVNAFLMAHKKIYTPEAKLNHYICKTIEEFISNKMVRLCGSLPSDYEEKGRVNLRLFLKYNRLTFDKLKYMNEVNPKACDELLDFVTLCCARYAHKIEDMRTKIK